MTVSRARDRRRYFVTWGWIDLLSSIPTVDALRWGRIARVKLSDHSMLVVEIDCENEMLGRTTTPTK